MISQVQHAISCPMVMGFMQLPTDQKVIYETLGLSGGHRPASGTPFEQHMHQNAAPMILGRALWCHHHPSDTTTNQGLVYKLMCTP